MNPYQVFEIDNVIEYCFSCRKYHQHRTFYYVFIGGMFVPDGRFCNKKDAIAYCKKLNKKFNKYYSKGELDG